MKQIIAYSLLALVVFAFNFKAISYLFDSCDKAIVYTIDDCEEEKTESEKTESEKSDEKSEKKEISEYLCIKSSSFYTLSRLSFAKMHNFLFVVSDYSKAVYMPPEKPFQA